MGGGDRSCAPARTQAIPVALVGRGPGETLATARHASAVQGLSWLRDRSVHALRDALRIIEPVLAEGSIVLQPWLEQSNPLWCGASAVLDDAFIVKFTWSQHAAERLWHEAHVLQGLARWREALRVPEVVAVSSDPVLVVTRLVPGRPLRYDMVGALDDEGVAKVASELASYLAAIHQPAVRGAATAGAMGEMTPANPQATTDMLRERFGIWVRPDQEELVLAWCDWVDSQLLYGDEVGGALVHGDFHGHNQLWDTDELRLRLVVDYETSTLFSPSYDFRYLPAQGPGVELLRATLKHYRRLTGLALLVGQIMAWHIRTALGDALWRSEANVELPGGGTPSQWVDELAARLDVLGVGP